MNNRNLCPESISQKRDLGNILTRVYDSLEEILQATLTPYLTISPLCIHPFISAFVYFTPLCCCFIHLFLSPQMIDYLIWHQVTPALSHGNQNLVSDQPSQLTPQPTLIMVCILLVASLCWFQNPIFGSPRLGVLTSNAPRFPRAKLSYMGRNPCNSS